MAETFIHEGAITTLSPHSSPGLLFLSNFIPALDSLSPTPTPSSLSKFTHPTAHLKLNNSPPIPLSNLYPMFSQRSKNLAVFQHDVTKAWDIISGDGDSGKRTVMYESISVTVFKDDEEGVRVNVREFNVLELEGMEGGVEGLGVRELRTFMDAGPVVKRMGEIKKS